MARRPITGMFTNVQEMSPDEFASGVTALPFIIESSGGDAFKENLIDQSEIDAPDQDVGTSELGSIESIFEILMDIMAGTHGTI